MIILQLMGGLGNQMFQYAMARTLADNLDSELYIDTSKLKNKIGHDIFSLSEFNIRANIISNELYSKNLLIPNLLLKSKLLTSFFNYKIINEKNYSFSYVKNNIDKKLFLNDYWQSNLYFESNKSNILNDLQLKKNFEISEELLRKINQINSVSIHIRRGDYVTNNETYKFHGVCSKYYYNNAIRNIKSIFSNSNFIIFSNDIEWAKNNIDTNGIDIYFSDLNSAPIHDLYSMNLCKHQIISNSTFSWWAAWLNSNPNKVIIAPYPWFAEYHNESIINIPNSWFRMSK